MNYWLLKSEPSTYSIDDLMKKPKQTDSWEGVRNFQARNFLRDKMKKGDKAFFYHSSCKTPGIVGMVEIVKEGYVDNTAFTPSSQYYDPKSTQDNPKWFTVAVKFIKKFEQEIPLTLLRSNPHLKDLILLRKGNRLSVMPVSKQHFEIIERMG